MNVYKKLENEEFGSLELVMYESPDGFEQINN